MGHHFVPQRYLRRFQDPDAPGEIWLHDRSKREAKRVAIKAVAQAKHFYSDETERRLASHVESPANAVIEKLIDRKVISDRERETLAVFVGTMACRVPIKRRRSLDMVPESLNSGVLILDTHFLRRIGRFRKIEENRRSWWVLSCVHSATNWEVVGE